jgi:hypothetical protein
MCNRMLQYNIIWGNSLVILWLPGLESREYGRRDLSCWPHSTLCPQKLALTFATNDGHLVSIVHSRTQATEFSFLVLFYDYRDNAKEHQFNLHKFWAILLIFHHNCISFFLFNRIFLENKLFKMCDILWSFTDYEGANVSTFVTHKVWSLLNILPRHLENITELHFLKRKYFFCISLFKNQHMQRIHKRMCIKFHNCINWNV